MRNPAITGRRAALSALVVLAVVGSGLSANAATKKAKPKPKPVCNLVTDKKGDADASQLGSNEDQALDIVSADVATDAKNITAVIRVAKLANPDSMSPLGNYYSFQFTGSSQQVGHNMYVQIEPTGVVWQGGSGTGVIDAAHNEIRMTLPLSYFGSGAGAIVPGPPLHGFVVTADWENPAEPVPGTFALVGDTANSTATYVQGTPSCVAVGK
jgi:hypothetical protein